MVGRTMQPDDALGRLDEHAHLIVVIRAGDRDTVHTGADHGAQDLPSHGKIAVAVLGLGGADHQTIVPDRDRLRTGVSRPTARLTDLS
jgi:hypothetical protein